MDKNNYVWVKEGYIGCNILHSNYRTSTYRIAFLGAENLEEEEKWRINFLYSFVGNHNDSSNETGYCTSMSIIIEPMEKIRFESFLGIKEGISVKYRPEESMDCTRFFPVQFIKFLYVEKDYIKYEVHCI